MMKLECAAINGNRYPPDRQWDRTDAQTDGRTDAQRDEEVATQYSFVSLNMVWDKNVFRNENSKVSKISSLFVTL